MTKIPKLSSDQTNELRWKHYASIPKNHWAKLSGRSPKIINHRAHKFDLPNGKNVDLQLFLRAIYDFLDKLPDKPIPTDEYLLMRENDRSPSLERYRLARARSEELTLEERKNQLIDRAVVHETLGKIASLLRGCGGTLQKQYGSDARDVLSETLDDIELIIRQSFANSPTAQQRQKCSKNMPDDLIMG